MLAKSLGSAGEASNGSLRLNWAVEFAKNCGAVYHIESKPSKENGANTTFVRW